MQKKYRRLKCIIPYLARAHLVLHDHEVDVYAQDHAARDHHYEDPEV